MHVCLVPFIFQCFCVWLVNVHLLSQYHPKGWISAYHDLYVSRRAAKHHSFFQHTGKISIETASTIWNNTIFWMLMKKLQPVYFLVANIMAMQAWFYSRQLNNHTCPSYTSNYYFKYGIRFTIYKTINITCHYNFTL